MKKLIAYWWTPATSKAEGINRYKILAFVAAVVAVVLLAIWGSVPFWVDASYQPVFGNMFLGFSGLFALLSASMMISTWFIQRDIF